MNRSFECFPESTCDFYFACLPQEQKQVYEVAQEAGEWLMEKNRDNDDVVVEVVSMLSKAQTKMDGIEAKVDERRDKLQAAILESQDIQITFAEFLNDMAGIEEELSAVRPVSAVMDTLKEQEREHKVLSLPVCNNLKKKYLQKVIRIVGTQPTVIAKS